MIRKLGRRNLGTAQPPAADAMRRSPSSAWPADSAALL